MEHRHDQIWYYDRHKKKAAAAVLQIAVKPYHWRGDYGSGISSQINPRVFLCKSIEDPG